MRLPWLTKSRAAHRKQSSGDRYRSEIIADVPVPGREEPVRFFSRKLTRPARLRRFSNRDLREGLLFGFYLGVAALLPLKWWTPVCQKVSRFRLKRHMRKDFGRYAEATRAVLGGEINAEALFLGLLAASHRRRLTLAAHLCRTRWSPLIRLEGAQGLQAALQRGRGAILWCDQFTAQTIIGKRALHEAGVDAHQVSMNFHGISDTIFGLRFLNPMLVEVENRFLESRIVFDRSDAYQVTARVQKLLKNNGIVLMTNTIQAGSTFAETAMGESGWTHLASAPANFAARAGTALFSMSTFETIPFREYRAVISPELTPAARPASETPTMDAKNMALLAEYILLKRDRLLEALKLYPEQMMSWSSHERLTERQDRAAPGNDAGSRLSQ